MKISEYAQVGDSLSLKLIDGLPFTIIKIEDSDYDDGGEITKGVKITTKENFALGDAKANKFHTTRIAVVNKLNNANLRSDVNGGEPLGPVKCERTKAQKGGKEYFDLVDC